MIGRVRDPRDQRRTSFLLACIDVMALLLFTVAGIRSHHETSAAATFLRNAVPLAVSWMAFAVPLGTYRRFGFPTLWRTWLVAVPVALVARTIWVGSPTGFGFLTFLVVGMGFTALFLVMGRGLAALVTGRGYPQRARGNRA
jgi:Protein of unknown function (DUF3054)